jgi:hypothetical protein
MTQQEQPPLILTSIQFHDRRNGKTIPLRRSETGGSEYRPPEWTARKEKPEDAPAAYLHGSQDLALQIRLERSDSATADAFDIWAEDGSSDGNFLGCVQRTRVEFQAGVQSLGAEVRACGRIPPFVSRHDDCLLWKAGRVGAPDSESFVLATTRHRIYSLLRRPTDPWDHEDWRPLRWVWTTVLDLAVEWAKDCSGLYEAASQVTRRIHALGDPGRQCFQYNSEEPGLFAKNLPFSFDCARFVHMATRAGAETNVNVDCLAVSSMVVTVANSLGCWLHVADLNGSNIQTSMAFPIGQTTVPASSTELGAHEIAIGGHGKRSDLVWDACFELDPNNGTGTSVAGGTIGGAPDAGKPDAAKVLGGKPLAAVPFDLNDVKSEDYARLLLRADHLDLTPFRDRRGHMINRAVMCRAPFPEVVIKPEDVVEMRLPEVLELFEQKGERSRLFVHNFFWTNGDFPDALGLELFEKSTNRDPYRAMEAQWARKDAPNEPVVRTVIYEGSSRYQAREIFAARLQEYTAPVQFLPDVGEVAFRGELGYAVAMTGNTVFTTSPIGKTGFDDMPVLRAIDEWLQLLPDEPAGMAPDETTAPDPVDLPRQNERVWYLLSPRNAFLYRDSGGIHYKIMGPDPKIVVETHENAREEGSTTTIPL